MMKMHTHVLLLLLGVIAITHDEDQISFPFQATLETYLQPIYYITFARSLCIDSQ